MTDTPGNMAETTRENMTAPRGNLLRGGRQG
jgi:hypothetical protein